MENSWKAELYLIDFKVSYSPETLSQFQSNSKQYQFINEYNLFSCLFVPLENICLYGSVAIAGEGLQNAYACLCSATMAFEEGGIFIVPHLLWHGALVFVVSSEGPVQCSAFYDKQRENIPVLKQVWMFYSKNCHTPTKRKLKLNGEIALTILRILQKPCEKFNQTWLNASMGEMDGSLWKWRVAPFPNWRYCNTVNKTTLKTLKNSSSETWSQYNKSGFKELLDKVFFKRESMWK